jgi:hypothetical protein
LNRCRLAFSQIESGQPRSAEDILNRLRAAWPNAAWLVTAAEQSRQMGDVLSQIRGSPLSLLGMDSEPSPSLQSTITAPPIPKPIEKHGSIFCLHVDGVGSFQILTTPTVSLGPAGASRSVDVPLMLDSGVPVVTILRSEDDYFLRSGQSVFVNDVQTANKLLSNGDRIGLGTRSRIIFRRPSPASSSAVLDLSGARLPSSTARQVVLMDREIILGPGSTAHVRADDLPFPIVLQRRGDGFFCRSAGQISVEDKLAGNATDVPVGAHISVGSLRFVIAREAKSGQCGSKLWMNL